MNNFYIDKNKGQGISMGKHVSLVCLSDESHVSRLDNPVSLQLIGDSITVKPAYKNHIFYEPNLLRTSTLKQRHVSLLKQEPCYASILDRFLIFRKVHM